MAGSWACFDMDIAFLALSLAALLTALALLRVQRRRRIRGERPAIVMRQLQARIAVLREELATERMRVVACGAAANGIRTPESSPYWSPSHADVCRLADRARVQADLLAAAGEGSCALPAQVAAARFLGRAAPAKDFWATEGLHLPPS